jgi:endonuclease/exonuclease/phosphatase family metal-dependent hydrolase
VLRSALAIYTAWALALCFVSPRVTAESLRVLTWNIDGGQISAEAIRDRASQASEIVGPMDVVVLQEVISEEQVAAAAAGFGLTEWAISDWSPPIGITDKWFRSLEVAVISRLPMIRASEWDTTGRRPQGDGFPPRASAENVPTAERRVTVDFGPEVPSRGYLRVDLDGGWTVYAVHWKSSRGQSCNAQDIGFARQREDQAAGLADDARLALRSERTVIIAGDFNIQSPGRVDRVGTDTAVDCAPTGTCDGICGSRFLDGYDDSIHRLLALDETARLLSAALDETFVGNFFPGGAIDHVLVVGPLADGFIHATTPQRLRGNRWLGSDHRPVLAVYE